MVFQGRLLSHLCYTSEDISQSQTRVKLNRKMRNPIIFETYISSSVPTLIFPHLLENFLIGPSSICGVSTPAASIFSDGSSTFLKQRGREVLKPPPPPPPPTPFRALQWPKTGEFWAHHEISVGWSVGYTLRIPYWAPSASLVPGCLARGILTLELLVKFPPSVPHWLVRISR